LSQTRNKLIGYRDQIAAMSTTAEVAAFKDRAVTIFNKYIQACDLYLQAMREFDQSLLYQANALVNEASAMIPRVK
jgi:hypothetical protein